MIYPRAVQTTQDVAAHYDDLDPWYRRIWGEHVHHGLWNTGKESTEIAVTQLVDLVAEKAGIGYDTVICDVGCGYGATARYLTRRYGAHVVGYTLSKAQYDYARTRNGHSGDPRFHLCDWLNNGLSSEGFDAVISIESSEHFADKAAFFAEAFRLLKPGGRLAVCAWLAADSPTPSQVQQLLEPICREGRLPGLGNESEYLTLISGAGFADADFLDLTARVRKTWTVIIGRMLQVLTRDRNALHFLLKGPENRVFAKTVWRIWRAYAQGAMRYGLFTAIRPM